MQRAALPDRAVKIASTKNDTIATVEHLEWLGYRHGKSTGARTGDLMEKILVVGDLHCKMSLVLPHVLDAAIGNCCDVIIFTGDLCDDWGVDGEAMMRQLEFAASWREDATKLGIETVFLLGNHDSAYVGMVTYHFTKWDALEQAGHVLREKLDVRIAVAAQGYLLTHAGLVNSWALCSGLGSGLGADELAKRLCDMCEDPVGRSKLVSCGPIRGGWGEPGPLWADRRELVLDPYTGCSQIVGHSPVESAARAESGSGETLWFVDTLSLHRSGSPIGDATALILCEGQATPVRLFDDWNEAIRSFCEGDAL